MDTNLLIPAAIAAFFVVIVVRRLVQASAARKLIEGGALVIDVRSPQEFSGGHVNGAHLIPVHELEGRLKDVERLAGREKGRAIVVYCRSGARSGHAKLILERAGYTSVTNGGAYAALAR